MANQQAMNQVIVGGIQSAGSAVSAGLQNPMGKKKKNPGQTVDPNQSSGTDFGIGAEDTGMDEIQGLS